MGNMFNGIARPFGAVLMWLYEVVNDYALALLLIAVIVKVVLLPFQMKAKRGQLRQTRLQPKIAELQKKHGANKQKLNEEQAKLYKEEGINPASGCLWGFIQMPIMIALFTAIRQPLTLMMGIGAELLERGQIVLTTLQNAGVTFTDEVLDGFYAQVHIAQEISHHWDAFKDLGIEGLRFISFNLGIVNFAETPDWQFFWSTDWGNSNIWLPGLLLFFLPVISGGAQFISASIMRKMSPVGSPEAAGGAAGNILKFMPLMSVWFGFILPAALSFYWTIGTVLQIGQDIWLTKKYTKILDEEDAEKAKIRQAKEAEMEAKRLETERKKAEGRAEQDLNTSKRKKKKGKKQGKKEKAAEWEKKNAPVDSDGDDDEAYEPSRVGNRRYARGRAYDPDRYKRAGKKKSAKSADDEKTDNEDAAEELDENLAADVESDDTAQELSGDIGEDDSVEDDESDVDYDENDDDIDDEDVDIDDDDGSDVEDDDDVDEDDDPDDASSERFGTKRFD